MPQVDINGTKIYYEWAVAPGSPEADKELAPPPGRGTVAFLNGVTASTSSWVNQVPVFLAAGYRVLLHDFRGQLKSEKPAGPYRFALHAQDLMALMDRLQVPQAHLVGTSYGGEVAMRAALDFPRRVQSVAIIDAASELDPVLSRFLDLWDDLAKAGDGPRFFSNMVPTIYGADFVGRNQALLKAWAGAMKAMGPDYFEGQRILYRTLQDDLSLTPELDHIQCPALVVCGEDDILKPRKFSDLIAARIPGSEYALIPGSGHGAIFEKPGVLNSLLLGFIAKQG